MCADLQNFLFFQAFYNDFMPKSANRSHVGFLFMFLFLLD